MLDRLGLRGPAEIPGKRAFVYRFVLWRARQSGLPLAFPPSHPFNPLAALRLCIAAGSTPEAVDAIFDWIWRQGRPADDAQQLEPVATRLGIGNAAGAIADPAVKAQLKANFEAAMDEGVFGVPTLRSAKAACSGATMRMISRSPAYAIPACWMSLTCVAWPSCP